MKIILVYPQTYATEWEETGRFIHEALNRRGHEVIPYDDVWRSNVKGNEYANKQLIKEVKHYKPDLLFLLKSEPIQPEALERINCKKILWHPDVRKKVQDWVVKKAKQVDLFYTMSKGSIPGYKKYLDNVYYLPEACDPNYHYHEEEVDNYYKSDVTFIGNLRNSSRVDMIKRVIQEGYNFKIWGGVNKDALKEMDWNIIKPYYMNKYLWREFHSYAASNSINITWDWCPEIENSYSARIYRVMASQGLYLCRYVKGIEKVFERGVHCDWYHTLDEMNEKIKYYLKHPQEMEKIGENAQKLVYKKHTFDNRINKIMTMVNEL